MDKNTWAAIIILIRLKKEKKKTTQYGTIYWLTMFYDVKYKLNIKK